MSTSINSFDSRPKNCVFTRLCEKKFNRHKIFHFGWATAILKGGSSSVTSLHNYSILLIIWNCVSIHRGLKIKVSLVNFINSWDFLFMLNIDVTEFMNAGHCCEVFEDEAGKNSLIKNTKIKDLASYIVKSMIASTGEVKAASKESSERVGWAPESFLFRFNDFVFLGQNLKEKDNRWRDKKRKRIIEWIIGPGASRDQQVWVEWVKSIWRAEECDGLPPDGSG